MRIHDKHGSTYELVIGASIWLDKHVVGHALRTHNTVIMRGFTIPTGVRRRGVGSVLLDTIERHYRRHGVVHVKIVIPSCADEAHNAFFTARGYKRFGETFEKFFAPLRA